MILSAEYDTDYFLVCCKLRLQPMRMRYAKSLTKQCHHDLELNQIDNIHQVSEGLSACKPIQRKNPAESGYCQGHHPQYCTEHFRVE